MRVREQAHLFLSHYGAAERSLGRVIVGRHLLVEESPNKRSVSIVYLSN
jgi:hypothetical protein